MSHKILYKSTTMVSKFYMDAFVKEIKSVNKIV